MIQAQLDYFKDISARILIEYTNGHVDSKLRGTGQTQDVFQHCLRLHYLWGIMDQARLVGTSVYIGDTLIDGDDIERVYGKIWHYKGIFADIDLSDYEDVDEDDGDGGTDGDGDGGGTTTPSTEDHYRAGTITSVQGTNVITFSTPLPSSDYRITGTYNIGSSGYQQHNLVATTKTKNGFVVTDVLEAGTLHYFAVIDL